VMLIKNCNELIFVVCSLRD